MTLRMSEISHNNIKTALPKTMCHSTKAYCECQANTRVQKFSETETDLDK